MTTASAPMRRIRIAAIALLCLAYPFAIAEGLDVVSARAIGLGLLVVVVAAALAGGRRQSQLATLLLRRFGVIVAVSVAAAATNHPVALTLLPSLTSLWLLYTFGATLRGGGLSMVEQVACAMHEEFPDFLLPYCRKITWMWCGFFAVNAIVGAVLALAAPARVWAFYTGFLSYALMTALGVGEYVFHKIRFRFYEDDHVLDGLWQRVLPADRTALGRRTLAWQIARRGGAPGAAASAAMIRTP